MIHLAVLGRRGTMIAIELGIPDRYKTGSNSLEWRELQETQSRFEPHP